MAKCIQRRLVRASSPPADGGNGEKKPNLYELYKERRETMPDSYKPYFEQSWFRELINRKKTGDPEEDAAADRMQRWIGIGIVLFFVGAAGSLASQFFRVSGRLQRQKVLARGGPEAEALLARGSRSATRAAAEQRAMLAARQRGLSGEEAREIAARAATNMRLVSPEETLRLQRLALEWTELRDRHRERHPLWHIRLSKEKTDRKRAKAVEGGGTAASFRLKEEEKQKKQDLERSGASDQGDAARQQALEHAVLA